MAEYHQNPTDLDPDKLAQEILRAGRTGLFVKMRFLSQAIHMLTPEANPFLELPVATDGKALYYNAPLVLRKYMCSQTWATTAWLHMLFHCMFGHVFFTNKLCFATYDLFLCLFNLSKRSFIEEG